MGIGVGVEVGRGIMVEACPTRTRGIEEEGGGSLDPRRRVRVRVRGEVR